MKKVVALLLAIALSPVVMAQDRNVRLDLFGAANVVGASYDARFKGIRVWVSRSVSGTVSASGTGTRFMVSACRWRSTTWQVEETSFRDRSRNVQRGVF